MSDLIQRTEAVRRRLGLRQAEVATALGVTQGHYSKVANARTPLAKDLAERMSNWVDANISDDFGEPGLISDRMAALVASIQRQCSELLHLSAQVTRGAKSTSQLDE